MSATTPSDVELWKTRECAQNARIEQESLLKIPLVRAAFSDLNFRLIPRAIDCHWTYKKVIPIAVTGFNPFHGAYFYGQYSRFAEWIKDPFKSPRELNENDHLLREVLFMAHDYLHAWAYQVIEHLHPEKEIMSGAITKDRLEDFLFFHLLTEAVATVGLDYWQLSVKNVNSFCPIGSTVGPLTIHYQESLLPEYKRFFPSLEVQTPEFFCDLATFYCTGSFLGFSVTDLRQSPQLMSWLRHELSYGQIQRKLTRSWLASLASEAITFSDEALAAPVSLDSSFKSNLIKDLSVLLWNKVHGGAVDELPKWRLRLMEKHPKSESLDFRFINLGRLNSSHWVNLGTASKIQYTHFLGQYLSAIHLDELPKAHLQHITLLKQERSVKLTHDLLGHFPRLEALPEEPLNIFLAN